MIFPKPNVIFIAVDDLKDWVGYLGGHPQSKTPKTDKFSKKGVFTEHIHLLHYAILLGVCIY